MIDGERPIVRDDLHVTRVTELDGWSDVEGTLRRLQGKNYDRTTAEHDHVEDAIALCRWAASNMRVRHGGPPHASSVVYEPSFSNVPTPAPPTTPPTLRTALDSAIEHTNQWLLRDAPASFPRSHAVVSPRMYDLLFGAPQAPYQTTAVEMMKQRNAVTDALLQTLATEGIRVAEVGDVYEPTQPPEIFGDCRQIRDDAGALLAEIFWVVIGTEYTLVERRHHRYPAKF